MKILATEHFTFFNSLSGNDPDINSIRENGKFQNNNPSSKFVNSLVDYSADGGGNIHMKVASIRKRLHTAQSPSEFNIEEQLLKDTDWDKLNELFKNILI